MTLSTSFIVFGSLDRGHCKVKRETNICYKLLPTISPSDLRKRNVMLQYTLMQRRRFKYFENACDVRSNNSKVKLFENVNT